VRFRLATRGSALARWQAEHVASALVATGADLQVELVVVETSGDRDTTTPLHRLGGQGVFVKEVQAAVLVGEADAAVHSAKDLRSTAADGLVIGAVPRRGDARDALVGATLADLGTGATVATGSVRRRAQLAAMRPDLRFVELRGNIGTRLERLADVDAVVMAAVALDRLDLADRIAERLAPGVMVPQVGQGALAVECRADDSATVDLLGAIDDADTRALVTAERAWLAQLGSGCDLPVGAHAQRVDGAIHLVGLLASLDGRVVLRNSASGTDPGELGAGLARRQLAAGGVALLGLTGGAGERA
jgi:hydroxymethylbilane synthase